MEGGPAPFEVRQGAACVAGLGGDRERLPQEHLRLGNPPLARERGGQTVAGHVVARAERALHAEVALRNGEGAGLFVLGILIGLAAVAVRLFGGVGYRPLLTLVEVCLLLGSIFVATGLLGEQIAGQRAQIRELQRQFDTLRDRSPGSPPSEP